MTGSGPSPTVTGVMSQAAMPVPSVVALSRQHRSLALQFGAARFALVAKALLVVVTPCDNREAAVYRGIVGA